MPPCRGILYLHEAHAPHYLDALICHFPGRLLRTKPDELGFGAEVLNWTPPFHHAWVLTEQKILLMAASIWKSLNPWSMLALSM